MAILAGEEGWVKTVIFWIVMEAVKGMQHRPGLAEAAQLRAAGCHQSKHKRQSSQVGALVNPCRLFGDGCGWGEGGGLQLQRVSR